MMNAVELVGHPFFIATLFQPERSALRGIEHSLVTAFVAAAMRAQARHHGMVTQIVIPLAISWP
jgi:CTP synthase (UTP-ammonia lyase)